MKKQVQPGTAHIAKAKVTNLPISTKQGVEISDSLRYKRVGYAKQFLENVISLKVPVPYRRFNRDTGHKKGNISAGRFPQKAAKEFLKLVKSVEANAQDKGFNTSNLKITKILANKASVPMSGGRHRQGTKRTHIEIEVREGKSDKKNKNDKNDKNDTKRSESKKSEAKKSDMKNVADPKATLKAEKISEEISEEIKEEVKEEIKKDIPKSPETKTEDQKEAVAKKVAEEVTEEVQDIVEEIAESTKEETATDSQKSVEDKQDSKSTKPEETQ